MAKAPQSPRPKRRRTPRAARTEKSLGGKIASVVAGAGALVAVGSGLVLPSEAPVVCNGQERWPVKVAADPDARNINLTPAGVYSVSQLNQKMLPEAYPVDGRMNVEKKVYTVRGFLSYFKQETGASGDRDYHVVITEQPGKFEEDEQAAPNGHSMVVEFPDPRCFGGKSGEQATSALAQAITDARATFEAHIKWPKKKPLTQPIPVTVTGVGFFDFQHGQTGRATPHPGATGGMKVFELHPVTEISFDNESDSDNT